ncbi:hypothetical protein ACFFJI_03925 [Allobacillus sp. GCM10007491]|uniref:hypothetical protein n=1 Tax=Allobacillus TaxID=1400133 RepID=UPI001F46FE29|nr:hypothetical protein [Allobacillus saliphilus]
MIREAKQEDVADLARLMGELGYPTTKDEMQNRFEKINSDSSYNTQVIEADGNIVGMIGMILGYHYEKTIITYESLLWLSIQSLESKASAENSSKKQRNGREKKVLVKSF